MKHINPKIRPHFAIYILHIQLWRNRSVMEWIGATRDNPSWNCVQFLPSLLFPPCIVRNCREVAEKTGVESSSYSFFICRRIVDVPTTRGMHARCDHDHKYHDQQGWTRLNSHVWISLKTRSWNLNDEELIVFVFIMHERKWFHVLKVRLLICLDKSVDLLFFSSIIMQSFIYDYWILVDAEYMNIEFLSHMTFLKIF